MKDNPKPKIINRNKYVNVLDLYEYELKKKDLSIQQCLEIQLKETKHFCPRLNHV